MQDNEDLDFTCTQCVFNTASWKAADDHEFEIGHMVIPTASFTS